MENETVGPTSEITATSTTAIKPARKKAIVKKARKAKKVKKAAQKAKVLGKRYSDSEKQRILTFIKNNPQRGSLSKAVKEFGVTFLTLKAWIKKEGVQLNKVVKSAVKAVKGTGKRGRPKGSTNKGAISKIAKSLKVGEHEFDKVVAEIQTKRKELRQLMAKLAKVAV